MYHTTINIQLTESLFKLFDYAQARLSLKCKVKASHKTDHMKTLLTVHLHL